MDAGVKLVWRSKDRLITWGNSFQDDEQGCGRATMDKDELSKEHFHSAEEKMIF